MGVARQIRLCRKRCEERGYEVIVVLEDNDMSAWRGKARPGYDQLLKVIRHGDVDVVVAFHQDRLTRSPIDLEDIATACERADVIVDFVEGGTVDMTTPNGLMVARITGAVARHESDHKAARIRAKHQELAESGAAASLHVAYGYNRDGSINPAEAAVVRDLADRLLAGESIRSLTFWLNKQGVPTKKGGKVWSASTVRQILTSARISGQREWTPRTPPKGQRKGWDGKPQRGHAMGKIVAKGDWDPIITPEQTDAIRSLVSAPERKQTKRRHYLLSAGILKCGICGTSMNHKVESRRDKKNPDGPTIKHSRYACIRQSARGCGGISIVGDHVDNLVAHAVIQVLSGADLRPTAVEPDVDVEDLRTRLDAMQETLVQIGLDHADGITTRAEWLAMRNRVEANIKDLEKQLPTSPRASVSEGATRR